MANGMFLAIEGVDGSGKTTQVERLTKVIARSHRIAFPSPTNTGKLIRQILSKELPFPGATALQLLFTADRAERSTWIRSCLERGETVITDRYSLSGEMYGYDDVLLAYPSLSEGRYKAEEWSLWFHHVDDFALKPDLYVVIDVAPEEAVRRIGARAQREELYDAEDRVRRIATAYNKTLIYNGTPVVHIDGHVSEQGITAMILERVHYRATLIQAKVEWITS